MRTSATEGEVTARPQAVRAEAPCRVDLAGGTLDLYPLSAMLGGTTTVNAAISVMTRTSLRARDDAAIVLRARDLGEEVRYTSLVSLDDRLHVEPDAPLALLAQAVRFWEPDRGLELETESDAPKGSGLGASSALLISVLGALRAVFGAPGGDDGPVPDAAALCRFAAAIEARHLQVPTGTQDYLAALHGGPLALRFGLGGTRIERDLPERSVSWLADHLLVIYSGAAHFSGAPNWAVLKRYVDGDGGTAHRLRAIDAVAHRMWAALEAGDPEVMPTLVREEWELRRGLADEVSTPELERLLDALRGAGALAAKACGAGGGGSVLALAPPAHHEAVLAAARQAGATPLAATLRRAGLRLDPA
jgi:D-glycero-alpha-D-manno-heptose-7-phosphate kinase